MKGHCIGERERGRKRGGFIREGKGRKVADPERGCNASNVCHRARGKRGGDSFQGGGGSVKMIECKQEVRSCQICEGGLFSLT